MSTWCEQRRGAGPVSSQWCLHSVFMAGASVHGGWWYQLCTAIPAATEDFRQGWGICCGGSMHGTGSVRAGGSPNGHHNCGGRC